MEPAFLIASPQMKDGNFKRTVVLLVSHNAEGALGIVVNRESNFRIGNVIESAEKLAPSRANRPVLWGGPVEPGAGFVIFRGNAPEGWQVTEELGVSASKERLADLVLAGQEFHLALGYAGWGPGQLDREFNEGSWVHVDATPNILFECPLGDRYDTALALLGVKADDLWMSPIDE